MQHNKLRNWVIAGLALGAAVTARPAQAQTAPAGGAAMQLPKGVTKVVSIDLHNYLLVEAVDAEGKTHYSIIQPRHVYSGGLARIFGGTLIPTADLITPESANRTGGRTRSGFSPLGGSAPFQQITPFAGAMPPNGGVVTANGGVVTGPFNNR